MTNLSLEPCQLQTLSHGKQNFFIVIASYVFYGWWDWKFLLLITFTSVCVVDCDLAVVNGLRRNADAFTSSTLLPFCWRFFGKIPYSATSIIVEAVWHANAPFSFTSEPPPEVPDWTTYTSQKQEEVFNTHYGRDWRIPKNLDSPEYLQDWKERLYAMMNEMKSICDRHGVRLIFFASPLASNDPYRANPVLSQRISDMAAHIRSMGIEYHDFRTVYPDNRFRDSDHLLRSTSKEFTRKFYKEILCSF